SAESSADAAALVEIIDLPSPFAAPNADVTDVDMTEWMGKAAKKNADIILLDYSSATYDASEYKVQSSLQQAVVAYLQHCSLFIAPDQMSSPHHVVEPAIYPEVLTIGSMDELGAIRPYSFWHEEFRKPDLFAVDGPGHFPLREGLNLEHDSRCESTVF